jgi:hypothetical protein
MILSFGLDTLVPTFCPQLKTFLELFSADAGLFLYLLSSVKVQK